MRLFFSLFAFFCRVFLSLSLVILILCVCVFIPLVLTLPLNLDGVTYFLCCHCYSILVIWYCFVFTFFYSIPRVQFVCICKTCESVILYGAARSFFYLPFHLFLSLFISCFCYSVFFIWMHCWCELAFDVAHLCYVCMYCLCDGMLK